MFIIVTQVDDRLDAEFGESFESVRFRLGTAKKLGVDLVEVGKRLFFNLILARTDCDRPKYNDSDTKGARRNVSHVQHLDKLEACFFGRLVFVDADISYVLGQLYVGTSIDKSNSNSPSSLKTR
jgi:hypothetical protein